MIKVNILPNPLIKVKVLSSVVIGGDVPFYTGATEVTPSQQTQTLQTNGKQLDRNIVVNPIPNNYGLITYNGYELTVS